ncbi:hypothetical protein TRFO_22223 [Tritrichomonas foetus]|uniref:Viral A-type inclusion protein n=1 Tax=Tritrichomonas foetus TaxID=1144522 RepID=A0A1J4KGR2_9EUKA|nr:hypothetical protein TRFO_22223 [Tritrichomonas foetus]|eukprot:OHT08988.1 hypothetical protein TRFO_22223 [Tritrichomonas foetus]
MDNRNDNSDIVKNLNESENHDNEGEVVDRIADQLKLKTPTTEKALIKSISEKLAKSKQLKEELIDTFDLPKNTHTEYIVTALNAKFASQGQHEELDSSDEQLRIQLSQVSHELNIARDQMRSLRENEQQQELTILELQKKINGLQNHDILNDMSTEIVDKKIDIARCKNEMTSLRNENEKLLRFKEKAQKRIIQLQKAFKENNEKNDSLSNKVEELKQEVQNKENEKLELVKKQKQLEQEKQEELQYPFEQLLAQMESQSKEISEEAMVRMALLDAIQKLTTVNSILEQRLDQSTQRISELENSREEAIKNQANQKQSNETNKVNTKPQKNETKNNKQRNDNNKNNDNSDDDESCDDESKEVIDESAIESAKSAIQSTNEELKLQLNGILSNNDLTVSKRLISTISTMAGSIHQTNTYDEGSSVLEERNQLLLDTVGSLLKFLNTMIESQEIQSWALSKYDFQESQQMLTSQAQTISQFMKDHCIEYLEDSNTILSAFVEQNDPFQLENTVKIIISKYQSVKTNEGKDLLILLHQSLAAGLLLQSYALQVTQHWSAQGEEVKELKSHIEELEQANERIAEDLKQEVEKTQEAIDKFNQMQDQKAHLEISDSSTGPTHKEDGNSQHSHDCSYNEEEEEEEASSKVSINSSMSSTKCDEEYIKELEHKLDSTRKSLEKYRTAIKGVKAALRTEVNNGNHSNIIINSLRSVDELESDHSENTQTFDPNLPIIQSRTNDQIMSEDQAIDKIPNTETVMKGTDEIDDIKSTDYSKQIEELTEENQRLNDQIKKLHQRANEKFAKIQESVQRSRAQMKEQFFKQKRTLAHQNQKLADALQKEIKMRENLEKKNEEINSEINELKQKNRQLTIDNKLITAKLNGRDEEIKREKSISESQWKLKQYNLQTSVQSKIEQYRQETDKKLTEFLISAVNLFKEHVDVNQTITCESVYEILSEVANRLTNFTKQANEMDKVHEVMKGENSNNNSDKSNQSTNPAKKIEELVKENKNYSDQIHTLSTENSNLKKQLKTKDSALASRSPAREWEEWAIPIYKKLTGSKATKPASYLLRKFIENALEQVLNENQSMNETQNDMSYTALSRTNASNNCGISNQPDVKVWNLCSVVIAAIRLQKMTNTFKSAQEITKTKFKANAPGISSSFASGQKFVRKNNETQSNM